MSDLQWGKLLEDEKNSPVGHDIVEIMRVEADFWLSQAQEDFGGYSRMTFLVYYRAQSIAYAVQWMNELEGARVPGYDDYGVDRIMHFQLIPVQQSYEVVVLVEASKFVC